MGRNQHLLFADPRPLEVALGTEFFQQAPVVPGVYLMRDASDVVVYVGKARNLRQRLASYRVANPERLRPRHLRLLRLVVRIELETCASESAALAREATLIRELRPAFNRAGVWPGPDRHFGWRLDDRQLVLQTGCEWPAKEGFYGPFGGEIRPFHQALARLLWCCWPPGRHAALLPLGWIHGGVPETVTLDIDARPHSLASGSVEQLHRFFSGGESALGEWIRSHLPVHPTAVDAAVWAADLDSLDHFVRRRTGPGPLVNAGRSATP